jgi:hypothetical protein
VYREWAEDVCGEGVVSSRQDGVDRMKLCFMFGRGSRHLPEQVPRTVWNHDILLIIACHSLILVPSA